MAGSPALAKGPDQATISGPGLQHSIIVSGDGEPGSGEHLGQLSDGSGLFLAMFGSDAAGGQALTTEAPTGPLGLKFTLTYRVPGGQTTPDMVIQDLYPQALGGPVTYTRAGQPSFGTKTSGGWYRTPKGFTQLLIAIGIPAVIVSSAPSSQPSVGPAKNNVGVSHPAPASGRPWMAISAGVLGACIVLVVAVVTLRRRAVAQP